VTNVLLYSTQPVLAAGLRSVFTAVGGFALSAAFPTLAQLTEQVKMARPDLLLVELTAEVTIEALGNLAAVAGNAPVVLWVDAISTELAFQAIGQGVRGILRMSLPMELQVKCLQKVAVGDRWLEEELSDAILCARRVALAPRERDLIGLLALGLKNKEISRSLGITEGTVKVYLSRLFQKVGVNDRFECALLALKNLAPNQSSASEPARSNWAGHAKALGAAPFFPTTFVRTSPVQAGAM
jgi:DNA-binding NarL/FixJ family response regulator